MLVSFRHRLVIFAMPKCASSALESALAGQMDLVLRGHPGMKHTNFRKYDRHLRRYLESFGSEPYETFCLFREPEDWLGSWWRYRSRADIPDKTKSSAGLSFDAFASAHIKEAPGAADFGRQSRFVATKDGDVGIDHLFRYERADLWLEFLRDRLGQDIDLGRENASPKRTDAPDLSDSTRAALRQHLARDYEIYDGLDI